MQWWHGGTITQIAAGADATEPGDYPPATGTARITGDGSHLLFLSAAELTDYPNEGESEVFLYGPPRPGSAALLTCVSCNPSGEQPRGPATIHSLPTGSYAVGFWGGGSSAAFEPSSHPPVEATAGHLTAGIDAALSKGGRIAGEVTTAAGGAPLDGITVCLFSSSVSAAQRCAATGEGGGYAFQGLTGGSYQVGFSLGAAEIAGTGTTAEVGGFVPQFYDGVVTRAQAKTILLPTAGTAKEVNAALGAPALPAAPIPALPVSSPTLAAPRSSMRRGPKRRDVERGTGETGSKERPAASGRSRSTRRRSAGSTCREPSSRATAAAHRRLIDGS